jgi:hypothetical protein
MKYLVLLVLLFSAALGRAQPASQTVRGTVLDADSKSPLPGATVLIVGAPLGDGIATDQHGHFRFARVPLGRISLKLLSLGYQERVVSNVVVNAGQEVVLELSLQELATPLNEVVVSAAPDQRNAQNAMVLLSARSISVEETKRYAGGVNDPALILSSFAGVTNSAAGSNEVIVRGNSPKYVQWRLEGTEMTNPNHFADQNAVGGGVSALNNNLLATSDFYTGAFAPEYGDVLSGVYDVKLRKGNNERFQSILGVGLMGTDVTVEGPLAKGYEGSYLANYRYSTIGLLSKFGVVELEGAAPTFQDGAFKVFLPTKRLGTFSLFGLGGRSGIRLDNINPGTWQLPTNETTDATIRRDYAKASYLLNAGLSHTLPLHPNGYLNTTVSFSGNGIEEDMFESDVHKRYDDRGTWLRDSLSNKQVNYQSRLDNRSYRAATTYNHKLNAKNRIQVGTKYAYLHFAYRQGLAKNGVSLVDFDEGMGTLRNFVSWKHRLNDRVTVVAGVHNMNVLYNRKSTLEPRLALNWFPTERSTVSAGYGLHSTMESVHNYFAKVKQADGSYTEPNQDLDLLKAHHFVAGYEYQLTRNLRVKLEGYYQHLYNLPVENLPTSSYATLNEGVIPRYVALVNQGTGRNYGAELTLERFFDRNYYFLLNTSLFQSTYQALDGQQRHTAYADNYLVNLLAGKEFSGLGRKDNQTLSLNAKVFLGGGKRYVPLLRGANGRVAVDPARQQFWDAAKAYDQQLDDIYQVVVSASYKWNKRQTTHELFLNIDNVTNNRSRLSEYYDADKPNATGYQQQFGLFPNLMYRIYL